MFPQAWGCRLETSGWLHHDGVSRWAQNVHSGCSTARQMLGWVRRAEGHGVEGAEKTWGKFCLFSATAPWQRRGGHKAKEFALCRFSISEGAAGITGWGQGAGPAPCHGDAHSSCPDQAPEILDFGSEDHCVSLVVRPAASRGSHLRLLGPIAILWFSWGGLVWLGLGALPAAARLCGSFAWPAMCFLRVFAGAPPWTCWPLLCDLSVLGCVVSPLP